MPLQVLPNVNLHVPSIDVTMITKERLVSLSDLTAGCIATTCVLGLGLNGTITFLCDGARNGWSGVCIVFFAISLVLVLLGLVGGLWMHHRRQSEINALFSSEARRRVAGGALASDYEPFDFGADSDAACIAPGKPIATVHENAEDGPDDPPGPCQTSCETNKP